MAEVGSTAENSQIPKSWNIPTKVLDKARVGEVDVKRRYLAITIPPNPIQVWNPEDDNNSLLENPLGSEEEPVQFDLSPKGRAELYFAHSGDCQEVRFRRFVGLSSEDLSGSVEIRRFGETMNSEVRFGREINGDNTLQVIFIPNDPKDSGLDKLEDVFIPRRNIPHDTVVSFSDGELKFFKLGTGFALTDSEIVESPFMSLVRDDSEESGWRISTSDSEKIKPEDKGHSFTFIDIEGKETFLVEWEIETILNNKGEEGEYLVLSQTHLGSGVVRVLQSPLKVDVEKVRDIAIGEDQRWRALDQIVGANLFYSRPKSLRKTKSF